MWCENIGLGVEWLARRLGCVLLLDRNYDAYSVDGSRDKTKDFLIGKLVLQRNCSNKTIIAALHFHNSAQPVCRPDLFSVPNQAYIIDLDISMALEPFVAGY